MAVVGMCPVGQQPRRDRSSPPGAHPLLQVRRRHSPLNKVDGLDYISTVPSPYYNIKEKLASHTFITAVANILEIAPALAGQELLALKIYIKCQTCLPCEVNGETELELRGTEVRNSNVCILQACDINLCKSREVLNKHTIIICLYRIASII